MSDNIDKQVGNYTLPELMAIVGLDDLDPKKIVKNTNFYINKYKKTDPELSVFFQDIQSQLLNYASKIVFQGDQNDAPVTEGFSSMNPDAEYPDGQKQTDNWYENEALQQSDENQDNKITKRKQKIDVYGNQHVPMNRDQLGVNNTYQLPVAQDSLNPNLKNVISRFVNLDSQFRQYGNGIETSSTDYTCDLSDTLKNVLSIKLYSYQIPYSWYTIDLAYGNTCFWIEDGSYNVTISMPSGNYTTDQFVNTLNNVFTNSGFTFSSPPVTYNSNTGKITLNLYNGVFNGIINDVSTNFTITENTIILFYDFTGIKQCLRNCTNKSNFLNSTLGWLMGYRMPFYNVNSNGNVATAVLNLNGTKYLMLIIDDYNQNHVNNSLVSISELSSTVKLPYYYSPDLPYTCFQQSSNLNSLVSGTSDGLLIAGKYESDYSSTQIILPSAPRTLTASQIYTINQINSKKNNLTNYRAKAPTSPDILAILPVKVSGASTGSLIVEFSGSLQDNERTYFGPVNIERMGIKLLDDKGNVVNLNGDDWCFTLICDCLYQY